MRLLFILWNLEMLIGIICLVCCLKWVFRLVGSLRVVEYIIVLFISIVLVVFVLLVFIILKWLLVCFWILLNIVVVVILFFMVRVCGVILLIIDICYYKINECILIVLVIYYGEESLYILNEMLDNDLYINYGEWWRGWRVVVFDFKCRLFRILMICIFIFGNVFWRNLIFVVFVCL